MPTLRALRFTFLGLGSLSCAPRAAFIIDATPAHEISQSPHSLLFQSDDLSYFIDFRHERATGRYLAVVWSFSDQGSHFEQQPHWLRFELDGQRAELDRWDKHQEFPVDQSGKFVCTGVLTQRCSHAAIVKTRYNWIYALPDALSARLRSFHDGRATLAVAETAVFVDLDAEEYDWLPTFFSATSNGAAYVE